MARVMQSAHLKDTLSSKMEELGSSFSQQMESASEALQTLAGALREAIPTDKGAALDVGRDIFALIRRHPLEALLIGGGLGYLLARRMRASAPSNGASGTVGDVMTRHVEVVRPDTPLQQAAAKMADLDVGAMPVCDGEVLVGLLTDRDITIRAVARGAGPNSPVRDVMTHTVRYAFEDEPLTRAMEMMQRQKIRRLPVLDRDRRLTGIVSLGDLAVDADADDAGKVLERVSEPARPAR